MNALRLMAALGLTLGLGACASLQPAARNTLGDTIGFSLAQPSQPQVVALVPQYDVTAVRVVVPETLRVSEANSFHPNADIVWHGDLAGNRYQQVQSIVAEGFAKGTAGMTSGRAVIVEVEMLRFHCLTDKTRYTFGGTHSVKFAMTVRDAASGAVIDGPRRVVADIPASGGARAIAEDEAGRTQRVVIVEHLTTVVRRELSAQRLVPDFAAVATSRLASNLILSPLTLGD